MPLTRALIGSNTNKSYDQLSNKDERLYKYNLVEGKDSALHFTFEFSEKNTNIRFARSYFLTNLSQHYMADYFFSDDEEERKSNPHGKTNELNTKVLLNTYICMLLTFQDTSELFMKHQLSYDEAQSSAYGHFTKLASTRVGEHVLTNGKDDFSFVIKAYNTMGEEVPLT